jgi:arabinose-5-phosphate isomerase
MTNEERVTYESDLLIEETIATQADAIEALKASKTVHQVQHTANLIDSSDGKVVVTGVGKSGDVGKKIVATLHSIGISSYFVHPVEALHGDLGVLTEDDIVLLLSNSGETEEVVDLLQYIQAFGPTTITITSNPDSRLATGSDHYINTKVENEGAVVNLVPMASTTTTMVVGDSIANILMARKGFEKEDFGQFHPGGTIGKKLLLEVGDVLYEDLPRTDPSDSLAEASIKMSQGGKGIAVTQDENGTVLGVLTDGDMRRLIQSGYDLHKATVGEVMIEDPVTIRPDKSAIQALNRLEEKDITQIVVIDEDNQFLGIVHIHDIMKEGLSVDRESTSDEL